MTGPRERLHFTMWSIQRLLAPVVEVRKEEIATMFGMFAYSFLSMTAYNMVQPITRSQFIANWIVLMRFFQDW